MYRVDCGCCGLVYQVLVGIKKSRSAENVLMSEPADGVVHVFALLLHFIAKLVALNVSTRSYEFVQQ
jgi:hypothetical protein